jgi:hypothetical protein
VAGYCIFLKECSGKGLCWCPEGGWQATVLKGQQREMVFSLIILSRIGRKDLNFFHVVLVFTGLGQDLSL